MDRHGKTRLLIITHGLHVGGVETYIYNMVKHLREDFDIRIACYNGGLTAERISLEFNTTIFIVRGSYIRRLRGFWELCRWADVVNVNGLGVGSMAAQLSRRYVVETVHNSYPEAKGVHRLHVAAIYRMADRCITYSPTVRAFTIKYFWQNREIDLFRHCVEYAGDWISHSGLFTVGYVGRFTKQRMISVLLEGFRLFRALAPEAQMVMVGAGELESEIREQENVTVFRPTYGDHLLNFMRSFDCFVYLTDKIAGMPIAPLEVMALGIPVISTETAASEELMDVVDHLTIKVLPIPESIALALAGVYFMPEKDQRWEEMRDAILRYHNPLQFRDSMVKYLRPK